MNSNRQMIIANGRIITEDIIELKYNATTQKYEITFKNQKTYSYNPKNVHWLKEPVVLDPSNYHLSHNGTALWNIRAIYVFADINRRYWHICFENGSARDYAEEDLQIEKSVFDNEAAKNVFNYLQRSAELCNLKTENGEKLLPLQYEGIDFIDETSALAVYLNPDLYGEISVKLPYLIFPFGCNASQFNAVKNALENKLSVIEGPPGTGKTQTILNIIANIVIAGKTVQVVSNNNSAIQNIYEKFSEYGLDFIIASLGRSSNKTKFLTSQTDLYPDFSSWFSAEAESPEFVEEIKTLSEQLVRVFDLQSELAKTKQELNQIILEQRHFEKYITETDLPDRTKIIMRKTVNSSDILKLWERCQRYADSEKSVSFFFKLKSRFRYGMCKWDFYKNKPEHIISALHALFYRAKEEELQRKISFAKSSLKSINAQQLLNDMQAKSMQYFKHRLYIKYSKNESRPIFTEEDLWKRSCEFQFEYPVVLSTTFSSRNSLYRKAKFDYAIMDEASQVDIPTGALALSNAGHAVIVGDSKQLPNVITDGDRKIADAIFRSFDLSLSYNFANNSFLSSLCKVIPDIPRTLLREHYRCHPKIINFCNQKFYNGNLIIMTNDCGESNVLSVVKTSVGNHSRGHMNQRQIDILTKEILPKINSEPNKIGIIAPYNDQINTIKEQLPSSDITVATVHKFQGREKDTIIMTTVDDKITDFTDNPYLLNVAVSRAKKQLVLITSGNYQGDGQNIRDLIEYIEYQNCSVSNSALYSVFDYLYSQYTQARQDYLKKHKRVSSYDSENLMYALITEVLTESERNDLAVICHQPLKMLIRDPRLLNDDECRYAMNSSTHLDFLIFNKISKQAFLAVEVDGYALHRHVTKQLERDKMKNDILDKYGIPYIRFATNGSGEKEILRQKINSLS